MRATTFSKICHLPNINAFLGADRIDRVITSKQCDGADLIVGWGNKKNTLKARKAAARYQIPYHSLEDGFIRSIGLGRAGQPSISLVIDSTGIYYDSGRPSDLEHLLNGSPGMEEMLGASGTGSSGSDDVFTTDLISQAQAAIALILKHKVTKYNGQPSAPSELFATDKPNILIVDQVADDASITYGAANFSLTHMVAAAKEENPKAQILVKLHPETIAGFRKGLFTECLNDPAIAFIDQDFNPLSVLEHIDKVYVATSQLGFEALMMGIPVTCFGMPFYAGWGITDDRVNCTRRTKRRTVEEVFAVAYILYSRYVNPVSGEQCDIIEAINYIVQQLKMEHENRSDVFCFGIRHWTRYNIRPFLKSQNNRIHFVKTVREAKRLGVKKGDQVVVWGTRKPEGLNELVEFTQKPAMTMEDGFLRSVGLGSDFVRPSSLVLDADGIYFDPEKPSGLELILQTEVFSTDILKKAERVRKKIIAARLTKYNLEPNQDISIAAKPGQTVILAPGQVEDDASILLGCESINSNLGLLKAIREKNPDAYIIYKPHPDVVSGNRTGIVDVNEALQYCDQVIDSISIANCLDLVDELHTMTSLVGFEALMRKIPVTVYGKPFYAGWGLTKDEIKIGRRNRRLILAELVAGTLLLYPRYYDWESGSFTDCEMTIDKLIIERDKAESKTGLSRLRVSYLERQLRKLGMLAKGVTHA